MMQNDPPNNPQQNPEPYNQQGFEEQSYDQSYIQQQINQQLAVSRGVQINVIEIIKETSRRLGKHFGNVVLGWIIYLLSFTLFWTGLFYLIQLFLGAALTSAFLSVAVSGFTFAFILKIIFLFIFIFIVIITSSMIFYFGFLSYIADLIELDSANYSNIFSGFQKVFQIAGLVTLVVVPSIIFVVITAIPFGIFNRFTSNQPAMNQPASSQPVPGYMNQSPIMDAQNQNPFQNPNAPNPNTMPMSPNPSPFSILSSFASILYSIFVLVVILLYISKLMLVPNLLIAQDMTLIDAVKESWNKVKGNTFLHVFLLLIIFGVLSYLVNLVSMRYIAPAMISSFTKWSLIRYTLVNALLVQVLFVYFIGCIAQIYNTLYPQLVKTEPFALASKYGHKTQRQYSTPQQQSQPNQTNAQPLQPQSHQQEQTTNPAAYYPYQKPAEDNIEPYMPQQIKTSIIENEKKADSTTKLKYKHQHKKSEPKILSEIQQAADKFKEKKETTKNDEKDEGTGFVKKPIQYVSQPNDTQKPTQSVQPKDLEKPKQSVMPEQNQQFNPSWMHEEEPKIPQTSHVTKFVDKQFEKDAYPVGKIVPVDALRMMKDPEIRFVEVQFQDMNHAMTIIKLLPFFSIDDDTKELFIDKPLSFSFSMPKIPSNPVKLFFGGKDMTELDLWKSKEVIIENLAKIVRINHAKSE